MMFWYTVKSGRATGLLVSTAFPRMAQCKERASRERIKMARAQERKQIFSKPYLRLIFVCVYDDYDSRLF